ncbi:MAG: hypothetical protein PHQ34_03700 [Methanothrix sp.]|nr:hypothetical protein [Methanothrix sp.]
MRPTSALMVGLSLLMAMSIVGSACYVCGDVPSSLWTKLPDKKPADVVHISTPLQSGMTYSWILKVKDLNTGTITTTPIADTDNSVDITVPADKCNTEMGVILTVTNNAKAVCTIAKCVWWIVPCPTCPTLPSFCEGKATAADASAWDVPGYAETWKMPDGTAFSPTVANLNALTVGVDTVHTAYMYLGTNKLCSKQFTVYNFPEIEWTIT